MVQTLKIPPKKPQAPGMYTFFGEPLSLFTVTKNSKSVHPGDVGRFWEHLNVFQSVHPGPGTGANLQNPSKNAPGPLGVHFLSGPLFLVTVTKN